MRNPRRLVSILLLAVASLMALSTAAVSQEVVVFGSIDDIIGWLKKENWWGEEKRGEQLAVPHALVTGINPAWREAAQALPVPEKKEIFYRLMLPLIVHANDLVNKRRAAVIEFQRQLKAGKEVSTTDFEALRSGMVLLRVIDDEAAKTLTVTDEKLPGLIDDLLYRLDIIPAGLALGQAAYESGYGTSRFAVEGNALFGQWTYGGDGIVPGVQRKELGDHRVASFDWPFDSVRGYFINLMSHPAYEEFRRIRARMRAEGKPLNSLALADGLINYSERGQEYVDTLKGMIRANHLDVADGAAFRDEPMSFIVGAESEAAKATLEKQIEEMRGSGKLEEIVARMRLD